KPPTSARRRNAARPNTRACPSYASVRSIPAISRSAWARAGSTACSSTSLRCS
ncbi:hypothetical protein, partial [Bilophila wadsworthia]|uniref:hypothetical protein n=1 Tax=Bilophila wadsworthia TaxID=35833 RepID=UPI003C6CB3F1